MTSNCWRWRLAILFLVSASLVRADQIVMQNGDRFSGSVVSMTPETVVFQSDSLGQVKLPRDKVSAINLGNTVAPSPPATNNSAPAVATQSTAAATNVLQQLGSDTNLVQQIRKQFLADAGPQANGKFDELFTGLMSGKMDINDLRAQAKSAADQLRSMKKDLGGDAGQTLDAYLSVLDNFLAQSAPASAPAPAQKPATNPSQGTIIIR
ncbi:MAG TPA: hypothetical protein VH595_18060 [Verrucomicrobiae bacterium]|jgi:hypothetical protein|nr:hypothetical protein [Verrucomicrobiae bacterium]